jgi:hypothetical protein
MANKLGAARVRLWCSVCGQPLDMVAEIPVNILGEGRKPLIELVFPPDLVARCKLMLCPTCRSVTEDESDGA